MKSLFLLLLLLAYFEIGFCFSAKLRESLSFQSISVDKAKLFTTISDDYLHHCHHVLITNHSDNKEFHLVEKEFVKQTVTPVLSYDSKNFLRPLTENILLSVPPFNDGVKKNQEFCILYFMLILMDDLESAITYMTNSDWFLGSVKYLVLYIDQELSDADKIKVANQSNNCLRIICVSKDSSKKELLYDIHEICLFCNNGHPALETIGQWNSSRLVLQKNFSFDLTTDFNEREFIVVSLQFPPYIDFEKVGKNIVPKFSLDVVLLDAIAKKYNFVYKLIEPEDGQWGFQFDNGSYTGVVGTVARREADFSMDLLITEHRYTKLTYTREFLQDPLSFCVSRPKPLPQWASFVRPLKMEVWLLLLVCLLFVGPIFQIFSKITKKNHRTSTFHSIFQLYGALLSQYFPWDKNDVSRIFIAFWLFFSLVATKMYFANLMAHLTIPTLSTTVNSLEELVKSDFSWGVHDVGGSDYELFRTSNVPLYQHIFREIEFCPNLEKCLLRSYNTKYAFISFRNYIRQEIHTSFKDAHGQYLLHMAKQDFFPSNIAFALQRGSLLKKPFDKTISRLLEAGMIPKWLNDVIEKTDSSSELQKNTTVPVEEDHGKSKYITLYHVQGIFMIYGFGMIVATLVLILEIAFNIILKK